MSDAMVTARMTPEKKEAGNRVLEQLGTNASQAVNRLYDYVIEKKELPFPEQRGWRAYTPEQIAEAIALVDSIPRKQTSRFDNMTKHEIKRERLVARGLMEPGDVE